MVSKAREDLPLPLGPVTTVSSPSRRSRSMPLRLFWRAPRIATQPCSADAVTHGVSTVFAPLFESTGDNRRARSGAQDFRGARAADDSGAWASCPLIAASLPQSCSRCDTPTDAARQDAELCGLEARAPGSP